MRRAYRRHPCVRTSDNVRLALIAGIAGMMAVAATASAQPDPYRLVPSWIQPPASRPLGSVSMVYPDGHGDIWAAERCGGNSCAGKDDIAPILLFDSAGRLVRAFGDGMFVFPHGIHVDRDGNVWVTDARGADGRGHQIFKFGPDGTVLMRLGEAGVAGGGPRHFNGPTDVVVAPNGDIFVSDGHEPDSNNRIVKLAPDGRFLEAWGTGGSEPGQFLVPHALAMDTQGRLFVADRDNNRIQIFDQEGTFLDQWTQFGRPSGIFIAPDDTIYVSDNQSNDDRNPGWRRGIRIGNARDGTVSAFIPDPEFDPRNSRETSAHGVAADALGNVYGAEVWSRTIKKYAP
jgi:sugar lactone lactonase YvrE